MGIRIEQIDITSVNKVFLMKDEVKEFISIVEDSKNKIEEIENGIDTKLENVESKVDTKLVETEDRINDKIEETDTKVESKFKELDTKFEDFEGVIDSKIENFEGTIDTKIEELGNNFEDFEGVIDSKLTSVQEDINTNIKTKLEEKANKTDLSKIATTGKYSDLQNVPTGIKQLENKTINDEASRSADIIWTSDKVVNYINDNVGTEVTEKINKVNNEISTIKDSLNSTSNIIDSLATKTEIERLQTQIETKADDSEINTIYNTMSSKVEFATFNILKDEVAKARRGKTNLLEKIVEIDTRLDKLSTTSSGDATTDLPVGTIIWYAGTTVPDTYALCDGSEINRNNYYELFKLIQTSYGDGDGHNTFNLPNLMTEELFIRSSGSSLVVGTKQNKGMTDVRESYEGNYNTDKLFIVGGQSFRSELEGVTLEPASISLLPCIKIQENMAEESDIPFGMLSWFGCELPEDHLLCDGRAVSRTTYAGLFKAIGTKYGTGDGSTTFNLPNLTSKNLFVKSAKNVSAVGSKSDSTLSLTDVREAYEGEFATDKFYPVGGNSFTSEHQQSEIVPPCIALNPGIKAKAKSTSDNNKVDIGTFTWYTSSTKPVGYLVCDGTAISRFDYADLFKVIGTTFGAGDGVSTFNLPNVLSKNKFIRATGNGITLGTQTVMDLVDIREAYEGDHNITGLYPLGAKYFTNEAIYEDIHPKNIALLPCIKAMNLVKVESEAITALALANSNINLARSISTESTNQTVNLLKEVTLKNSKAKLIISLDDLKATEVSSCFINVLDTNKGVEYICDINANAAITKEGIVVYLRGLDSKVSDAKVTLNIQAIFK